MNFDNKNVKIEKLTVLSKIKMNSHNISRWYELTTLLLMNIYRKLFLKNKRKTNGITLTFIVCFFHLRCHRLICTNEKNIDLGIYISCKYKMSWTP